MSARDALRVALQDVAESARSRRVAVTLLLYLAVSLLTMNGMISALQQVEIEVRQLLQLPPSGRGGVVTDAVWQSRWFRGMIRNVLRDDAAALDLFTQHPLAVAYGRLAFFYTPVLVMLLVPARLSEELGSGAIRYATVRVSRGAWLLGKFSGHTAMTGLAILMGAAGAWIAVRLRIHTADGGALARGMLWAALRTWMVATAFIGLGCGIGMCTRSAGRATALGILALILFTALGITAFWLERRGGPRAAHVLRTLLPQTYQVGLWRLSATRVLSACATLAAFAGAGLAAGAAQLSRRDL